MQILLTFAIIVVITIIPYAIGLLRIKALNRVASKFSVTEVWMMGALVLVSVLGVALIIIAIYELSGLILTQ